MKTRLKELLYERNQVSMEIERHLQSIADQYCPYKVGDVLKPKGYSHTDKDCRIISVYAKSRTGGEIQFSIEAIVLKKGGTDSQYTASWHEWHDDTLREAIKKIPE